MASIHHLSLPVSVKTEITLPGSKSESNRALLLHYLSNRKVEFSGLSSCNDVIILQKILEKNPRKVDVKESGTAMRFLLAYFCATNKNRVISGTERLCHRPVGKLVDALRKLGFRINFVRNENFPPVEVVPVEPGLIKQRTFVDASESSQYISALLLVAPLLPQGIEIEISHNRASQHYYRLTLDMLKQAGIVYSEFGSFIKITKQEFKPCEIQIGGDWSAAASWYSMAALAEKAEITLNGLKSNSGQGDKIIAQWMKRFGVTSTFKENSVLITKSETLPVEPMEIDFTDYPDLAQVMLITAAARNVRLHCTGIRNLRIKETDRIEAIRSELVKINARLDMLNDNECILYPDFRFLENRFRTFNDHRMVLALAPLAIKNKIIIEEPLVVRKSYPEFWEQIQAIASV